MRSNRYLKEALSAISLKCTPDKCGKNFIDFDDKNKVLNYDLSYVEIDIVASVMYEKYLFREFSKLKAQANRFTTKDLNVFSPDAVVLVDYYVEKKTGAQQIEITPDKFGGNYYLEASTLFRNTAGVDMPAEFIIPNCKIQSNFTFNMASSGDPSTFTFTMDAFPDYTRFDHTKKVLAAIQILESADAIDGGDYRISTPYNRVKA